MILDLNLAGYLPGFAIVSHVGRKSGRAYRTPVNAFRTEDGYIIAPTYGSESDWVKNVLATGSCELQTRGRHVSLTDPHIETDRSKGWAPFPVKPILGLHRRSPVHAAVDIVVRRLWLHDERYRSGHGSS